jgi:hypothetical protein
MRRSRKIFVDVRNSLICHCDQFSMKPTRTSLPDDTKFVVCAFLAVCVVVSFILAIRFS